MPVDTGGRIFPGTPMAKDTAMLQSKESGRSRVSGSRLTRVKQAGLLECDTQGGAKWNADKHANAG